MLKILPIMNDMIVIIFDLLFYIIMFPTREDTRIPKIFNYIGCVLIVSAYFSATCIFKYPAAVSSALCMAIPSFFLFLYYARYRDSRFVLTFCFIDTVSLMVAFFSRVIGIFIKNGEILALAFAFILFIILLRLAVKYANRYQILLEEVSAGWGLMAFASACVYFGLIFIAGYPRPMIERLEYVPVWIVFSVVVLSCYMVFLHSILKTKQISIQNKRLVNENKLYRMAFRDGLTGLYNRTSYMEKVTELEQNRSGFDRICFMIADINEFKRVNDTLGHQEGDQVLLAAADALKEVFRQYDDYIFRMGGDEFLVILPDVTEFDLKMLIEKFHTVFSKKQESMKDNVTMAIGYGFLTAEDERSIESAYAMADKQMYINKQAHKESRMHF